MKKPLRCLLHLHIWRDQRNEEGERYQLCLGCGITRDKLTIGWRG
jgi:hypothetical protein